MNLEAECKNILKDQGINPASEIDFDVNGKVYSLSLNYIIETYMLASEQSKLVFVDALKKSMSSNEMGINKFFEGVGQLLLMTHLSDKFQM